MKTQAGYDSYAQYFLGDDRKAANELFSKLKGNAGLNAPLHIDLMETVNDLPVSIKTISCSLEELSRNCQLITRTLFRLKTLEELD